MTLINDLQVLFSLLLTKYKEDVDRGSIKDINNPWDSNYRTICNEWAKDIDRKDIELKQIVLSNYIPDKFFYEGDACICGWEKVKHKQTTLRYHCCMCKGKYFNFKYLLSGALCNIETVLFGHPGNINISWIELSIIRGINNGN